jgi:hypothetical protein
MQYTRGEPKDFNGLGGKKSLAAEWDRWIADTEGGGQHADCQRIESAMLVYGISVPMD